MSTKSLKLVLDQREQENKKTEITEESDTEETPCVKRNLFELVRISYKCLL